MLTSSLYRDPARPGGWEIHQGEALEVLAAMPEASVDAIVTDPPYGLGFMGKAWDSLPPGDMVAKALLAVAKPGAHLLAFGGTRTSHRLVCALEDAGWEIRDSLMWIYGSGFPKSLNLDGAWDGWGTALKPGHEPIVLARKPLAGTVAANVAAHGCGALNVDGCRVGWDAAGLEGDTARRATPRKDITGGSFHAGGGENQGYSGDLQSPSGRWPPNLLLTHAADCGEACADGCPVAEMDRQSGDLGRSAGGGMNRDGSQNTVYPGQTGHPLVRDVGFGDSGGASRFFPRFRYQAKASSSERNAGLEGMPASLKRWNDGPLQEHGIESGTGRVIPRLPRENHHPTVKPVALMRWLCRLVTPPGGVVLDPFLGSGSTMLAALQEGFRCIGIEREPEYVAIARRRVEEDAPLFNRGTP